MKKIILLLLILVIAPWLHAQFTITPPADGFKYKPLEEITVKSVNQAIVTVTDACGNTYFTGELGNETTFKTGGALGNHTITLADKKNRVFAEKIIPVDCKTEILDEGNYYNELLKMLYYTIIRDRAGGSYHLYKGEPHLTFAGWFQDHIHVMKAMKYYTDDVTSGIDLFAKGQRKDGMIYDNYYHSTEDYKSWLTRFGPDFVTNPGDTKQNSSFFVRIPVENMSEFTFLEGVYYAWKATGNDAWMKSRLDNCIKVVNYSTSDPYRWSEKFKLLKRGYTIDIWDFQPEMDIRVWDGDIMMAKPGVTNYSVMYGDNVGMAVGCEYLTEMLEYSGRMQDAAKIRQVGNDIRRRIDELSWNGEFYTHHVPENPDVKRDFGNTDTERQVTISNSYAINRRIGHDKAVGIIKTYQRIAREMPESSAGEWYMCYPPYEKGWHNPKWEYMNGGVSSIVAGEVAHGAFEHGFEEYGVHILKTMWDLSQQTGGRLKCIYKGKMPEKPERNFTPIPLTEVANADLAGKGGPGVPGWTGEGGNDLAAFPTGKQVFKDIPFMIVDPGQNERRAAMILSENENYDMHKSLVVNQQASSLYILHAHSYGNNIGEIVLHYNDTTTFTKYIVRGENIGGWWFPRNTGQARVAWTGENEKSKEVGMYIYGFNNPHPDKIIDSISFNVSHGGHKWMITGLTLSDYPVFFMPGIASYGAPDNWGAAAVVYALIEGLAGVKDDGVAFDEALLAPRWSVAGVNKVNATVKYESSGGYLSYAYLFDEETGELTVDFTGNAEKINVKIYLPDGKAPASVLLNNQPVVFNTARVENSVYLIYEHEGTGVNRLKVKF